MRIRQGHRTAFLATCLTLVALMWPAAVAAHAQLESTTPAAGSTVDVPPGLVSATFDDDLVSSKSSIEVRSPDGSTVATGGVDADDAKTLSVAVPVLAAGTYDVRWAAATEDGHLERGRFAFTVAAAAASPEPTSTLSLASPTTAASVVPSSEPTAIPATSSPALASPSTAPDDAGGGAQSVGQIAIIALVGLGLGLGIGWWRSRRSA